MNNLIRKAGHKACLQSVISQIYSLKLSTSSFKKQAYQGNEEKVKNLLVELNNLSQKNQTVAPTHQPPAILPRQVRRLGYPSALEFTYIPASSNAR